MTATATPIDMEAVVELVRSNPGTWVHRLSGLRHRNVTVVAAGESWVVEADSPYGVGRRFEPVAFVERFVPARPTQTKEVA